MPRLAGPAEKEAGHVEGEARVRIKGLGVIVAALWGLALGGVALGWAGGVMGC